jgi:hypothetical protein
MLRPTVSQSWNKAPIWGLRPNFYYHRTVAGLLMWGALSDERTGLSFTIAAGPCQRSHSLVRAPLDSRPYFTVSGLRLPISSPPTTRRVTVEVFDPASTRVIFREFYNVTIILAKSSKCETSKCRSLLSTLSLKTLRFMKIEGGLLIHI